jgi:hypothetical protein
MSRETAWWELSHWAGTLKQLGTASRLAESEVQARVPYPDGYDPDASEFDAEKHRTYGDATDAHRMSVTIVEKDGYTSNLDSLDEMADRPHALDQIMAIVVNVGRATPSVEIRLRRNGGLSVEVAGDDRNWVAGLRQQLEAALKPRHRLHAPFGSDPFNFAASGLLGFFVVFIGIDQILYYSAHWSTKTGRLLLSIGLGCLWAAACGALAWASAKRTEVLPDDGVPRYERWRNKVLGWTGAVILAVIGTALYSVVAR